MNSLPWWANMIGRLIGMATCCGFVALLAWWKSEPVPIWGWYFAAVIGDILWTRPSYNRAQDFER